MVRDWQRTKHNAIKLLYIDPLLSYISVFCVPLIVTAGSTTANQCPVPWYFWICSLIAVLVAVTITITVFLIKLKKYVASIMLILNIYLQCIDTVIYTLIFIFTTLFLILYLPIVRYKFCKITFCIVLSNF